MKTLKKRAETEKTIRAELHLTEWEIDAAREICENYGITDDGVFMFSCVTEIAKIIHDKKQKRLQFSQSAR